VRTQVPQQQANLDGCTSITSSAAQENKGRSVRRQLNAEFPCVTGFNEPGDESLIHPQNPKLSAYRW
jgi:hypothetical protein